MDDDRSLTLGFRGVASPKWDGAPPAHLEASISYADRFGALASSNRTLKTITVLALIGLLLSVACSAWLASQARRQPYVVAVDKFGQSVVVGSATKGSFDEEVVVRSLLSDLFVQMCSVVPDDYAQAKRVRWVYGHLPDNSKAYGRVSEWYRNTYEKSRGKRIDVEVTKIIRLPLSDNYEVDLTEREFSDSGSLMRTRQVSATVAVEVDPPRMFETGSVNTLGIFLTDVQMQEGPWEDS